MLRQKKTVEFSNLSEDHKAEFIHFLIKNNICFQEGKQNCTAKIAVKSQSTSLHQGANNNFVKKNIEKINHKPQKKADVNYKPQRVRGRPLKDIVINNNLREKQQQEKQLKTPKKNTKLRTSTLSCKANRQTLQKNKKETPKSSRPVNFTRTSEHQKVSDYNHKNAQFTRTFNDSKDKFDLARGKGSSFYEKNNQEKDSQLKTAHRNKKLEMGREKPFNKYHHLFDSVDKGRAVRWPINMLERTIQQIYDQIFTRNTQCLQTRNIDNALKTLNLSSFPQSVQHYFFKKFKTSKLASTNLNNLLYSLSYHTSKQNSPIFLRTFQDFLTDRLQHQDILYYLFARNILKKQLKAIEKLREHNRHDGTYFPESIKPKQISKLLKQIIGKDNQLISQFRQIVMSSISSQDNIEAYEFLRILLDDFHDRRIMNSQLDQNEISSSQNMDNQNQYSQHNQQLTFGEDHYEHSNTYNQNQNTLRRNENYDFWECAHYSRIQDNLLELILEKLAQKSHEFVQILASDINQTSTELLKLQDLLVKKSQCMVRAVFQMNKMKWLRQLNILDPSEEDMAIIQNLQIKLKRLRQVPTGRDIGEFCKSILTVQQLVNELQIALTYD